MYKIKIIGPNFAGFVAPERAIVLFLECLFQIFMEKHGNSLLNTGSIQNLRIRTTQCELRIAALGLVFTEFCRNQ